MKKIFSLLVLCALLLTTLAVSASAATYYDHDNLNVRVNVKKSNAVKIDGVISAGEYEEYTDSYTEWYVAENASEHFDEAENMAKTSKWFFSWDGEYLNIAAQYDAGGGANQTFAGGDYYGDYAYSGTDEFIFADNFLAYGPGLNLVSAEASKTNEAFGRLFVAISENTATGEKITGMYSDQNGQNQDYFPPHEDFDFSFNGSVVTVEYRIPISELLETFKPNVSGQMFKISIVLQAGIAGNFEIAEGENAALYAWGVRLGQLGYACDASNVEKTHATFRLVDESVPKDEPDVTIPDETTPDVTTPDVTTPDVTTPDVTTPDVTTPDVTTPDVTTPDVTTPDVTTPDVTTPDNTPDAPPTGDIMVVAAALSAISACGVMIAKKRR
ncbi:MAG: hypothetical protein IKM46_00720 [Clostridia bacterium]|nr:hypothetical protein [Clostridia bacterium]